jgi:hypothetical protein
MYYNASFTEQVRETQSYEYPSAKATAPWLTTLCVCPHQEAQAVSRRPLTAGTWAHIRVCPWGFCGLQSGVETGFSPSSSVLLCEYHFITDLHAHISPEIWATGTLVAAVQRYSLTPSIWTATKNITPGQGIFVIDFRELFSCNLSELIFSSERRIAFMAWNREAESVRVQFFWPLIDSWRVRIV